MQRGVGTTLLLWIGVLGCGDPPPAGTDGGLTGCVEHAECDDGMFCNGAELCLPDDPGAAPDGCVAGAPPCSPREICEEALGVCRPDCEVEQDADDDGHDAIECGGDDCDDLDPERFPGNAEVCDVDGHDEDCDPTTFGTRDLDGDLVVSAECCNGSACGRDCDDNVRATHPGGTEVCDGSDNDCDGVIDEGLQVELFRDRDHDGVGALGSMTVACPGTPGFAAAAGDCDDTLAAVRPTAPEICDSIDNDCDGAIDELTIAVPWYVDRDGDGWGIVSAEDPSIESCVPPEGRAIRPGDCDDSDVMRNPEATERCNGLDDDCNGRADFAIATGDTEDDDRDGVPDARCELPESDCNDRDPFSVDGESVELCDLRDNDCDGMIDEGAEEHDWFADVDGDGFGVPGDVIRSCAPVPGRVRNADDCDDTAVASRPDAADACQGQPAIDDDCDGTVDEGGSPEVFYVDLDGDGYGSAERVFACFLGVGTARRTGDCDDTNPSVSPEALDDCAGITAVDDDCDGRMDESPAMRTFYADADGDGFGAGAAMSGCSQPAGTVTNVDDCDDTDRLISPLVPDDCGGRTGEDDDCDGRTDEGASPSTFFADTDGDGYGDPASPRDACGAPMGFVADMRDCDDTNEDVNLDASEVCDDLLDNDCNGATDCEDSACAGSCPVVTVVSGGAQSAIVHERYAEDLVVRVEDLAGMPLPGRSVTITTHGVLAESGTLRTSDAAGEARFPLRAGLYEGAGRVDVMSPGAMSVMVDMTIAEPAPGTIFTLVNGPRSRFLGPTPRDAWLMSGTGGFGTLQATAAGDIYATWDDRLWHIGTDGVVNHFAFDPAGVPLADGADARNVDMPTSVLSTRFVLDPRNGRLLFFEGRSIWAVELATQRIRFVGGTGADTSDGRPASVTAWQADLKELAVTPNGIVWTLDGNRLRTIALDGTVTTVMDASGYGDAEDVLIHNGTTGLTPVGDDTDDVYFGARCTIETIGINPCIVRARRDGILSVVAGGGADGGEDVPVREAQLILSQFMTTLPGGDVVMSDFDAGIGSHHRVRRFTPGGTIRTIAGTFDVRGDTGDGGPGTAALLSFSNAVAVWRGHVLIADDLNDAIRCVW